jgi:hypothetical protein
LSLKFHFAVHNDVALPNRNTVSTRNFHLGWPVLILYSGMGISNGLVIAWNLAGLEYRVFHRSPLRHGKVRAWQDSREIPAACELI